MIVSSSLEDIMFYRRLLLFSLWASIFCSQPLFAQEAGPSPCPKVACEESSTDWWIRVAPSLTPVFILISGLFGGGVVFLVNRISLNEQKKLEKRNAEEKKRAVLKLLSDEINKRWPKQIQPLLNECINKYPDNRGKCLKEFTKRVLNKHDLFVFDHISDRFSDFSILENNELLSDIVHAHVMLIDLVDLKDRVLNNISHIEVDNEIKFDNGSTIDDKKLEIMRIKGHLSTIDSDYEEFIKQVNGINAKLDKIDGVIKDLILNNHKSDNSS